eukprot:11678771-Alexandrium_andersonii.AAC.1
MGAPSLIPVHPEGRRGRARGRRANRVARGARTLGPSTHGPGLQGVGALREEPHLLDDGGELALDALGGDGILLLRAPNGLELAAAGSVRRLHRLA